MPRKPLIRTDLFPYHITARANNKEWFYLPIEEVWRILRANILKVKKELKAEIPVYVLMNNHMHFLIWTPEANIDKIMHSLLRSTANQINKRANRINHVFGGPYKWCLIQSEAYYLNVIRYIYQNPIRAGLIRNPDEYNFIFLDEKLSLPYNLSFQDISSWLKKVPRSAEIECIRNALLKRNFKIGHDKTTSKPYEIDTPFPIR